MQGKYKYGPRYWYLHLQSALSTTPSAPKIQFWPWFVGQRWFGGGNDNSGGSTRSCGNASSLAAPEFDGDAAVPYCVCMCVCALWRVMNWYSVACPVLSCLSCAVSLSIVRTGGTFRNTTQLGQHGATQSNQHGPCPRFASFLASLGQRRNNYGQVQEMVRRGRACQRSLGSEAVTKVKIKNKRRSRHPNHPTMGREICQWVMKPWQPFV